MINLNITKTILNENAEGYVDLSTAEEFELVSTTGCLTIIGTGKSKRLKLGKEIFEALGSPEAVGMKFMSNMLIIGQPEISKLKLTVAQDRIIYNNELACKIAEMSDVECPSNKSTKIGDYHLQQYGEGVVAVVKFN